MALELEEDQVEPFATDGMLLPLIRLTLEPAPPATEVVVGDQAYRYDRSYPIKGHSAVLPGYVAEQMAAGKKPLIIERPGRYYVYLG